MLGKKIAIDLGTSTVRMQVRGDAVTIEEPALLARRRDGSFITGGGAIRVILDDRGVAVRAIARAGIADPEALNVLVNHVLNRAAGRQRIFKPDVIAVVHTAWSGADRRRLLDEFAAAGTRTVYLLDSPLAAALGAGMNVSTAARLVCDLGAGTTEVAVVAQEASVSSAVAALGVDDVVTDIASILAARGVTDGAGEVAAELLRTIASADSHSTRAGSTGAGGGEVSASDLRGPVEEYAGRIAGMIRSCLADTSRRFVDDILGDGVVLTGGGALIDGLAARLATLVGLPVRIADDPLTAGVRGAAVAADSLDLLKRTFLYIR